MEEAYKTLRINRGVFPSLNIRRTAFTLEHMAFKDRAFEQLKVMSVFFCKLELYNLYQQYLFTDFGCSLKEKGHQLSSFELLDIKD